MQCIHDKRVISPPSDRTEPTFRSSVRAVRQVATSSGRYSTRGSGWPLRSTWLPRLQEYALHDAMPAHGSPNRSRISLQTQECGEASAHKTVHVA